MTLWKPVRHIFVWAGIGLLALLQLTFTIVQFQQLLLRYRAEQLMADMHQIRLHQSTWADAQRLMHRWGAWGNYEGSCTVESCHYQIILEDSLSSSQTVLGDKLFIWLAQHYAFDI